jgi:hypothetical protein
MDADKVVGGTGVGHQICDLAHVAVDAGIGWLNWARHPVVGIRRAHRFATGLEAKFLIRLAFTLPPGPWHRSQPIALAPHHPAAATAAKIRWQAKRAEQLAAPTRERNDLSLGSVAAAGGWFVGYPVPYTIAPWPLAINDK